MKNNKRSAAQADLVMVEQPRSSHGRHHSSSRSTRSTVRQEQQELQRLEQQGNLDTARLQRAQDLTATPLLQALPLVLVSGFLYKHEIRSAALVSKNWKSIWVEAQHEIPEYCKVEIKIDRLGGEQEDWPDWVKNRRLENVLGSQEFSRAIFQKLCDLKVAVEQTERKKQKALDALPKWGIDFMVIIMCVWDPQIRNTTGGICLHLFGWQFKRIPGWSVRIDSQLILTIFENLNFSRWKKVYDGQPLWNCENLADDDNDEAAAVPEDAVAPPGPPPGHGNIA